MKQCPVCKTVYSDDSLAFCLSDGTSLVSMSDPQETQRMSFDRNQLRVEIPSNPSSPSNPTIISTPTYKPKKSKGLIYTLLALVALLLIGGAGIAGFIFYNNGGFGKKEAGLNNPSSPTPTQSPSKTSEENTQELKERLANVEKQLSEQKNTKPGPFATPLINPTPSNSPHGTVTAKVVPTSDGFLALRSAPSAENGAQILKIPTGATVQLEDCQRNYVTIGGRRGRWCMISYGGQTGWAFDAFLSY